MTTQSFYLKEDATSCRENHPHGEWCLKVIVSLSGPNLTVSMKDHVAGLFETPFRTQEAAELAAKSINCERIGKPICLFCGANLTYNGGCTSPKCSGIHDVVPVTGA